MTIVTGPENYVFFHGQDDQKSASVQLLNATVKSSYGKFKGKTLDGKDIGERSMSGAYGGRTEQFSPLFSKDFSDSINRPVQSGFKVCPSEYGGVVSEERKEETVIERYLRLKEEVGLLISDVERVKAAQESSEKLLQVSPTDLLHDVSEAELEEGDFVFEDL